MFHEICPNFHIEKIVIQKKSQKSKFYDRGMKRINFFSFGSNCEPLKATDLKELN